MGKVAAKIKVTPDSPGPDLNSLEDTLEDSLPKGAKIKGFERDDVAFGLVALLPAIIVPDNAGGTEVVKGAFIEVEGVENVSVENIGRI